MAAVRFSAQRHGKPCLPVQKPDPCAEIGNGSGNKVDRVIGCADGTAPKTHGKIPVTVKAVDITDIYLCIFGDFSTICQLAAGAEQEAKQQNDCLNPYAFHVFQLTYSISVSIYLPLK